VHSNLLPFPLSLTIFRGETCKLSRETSYELYLDWFLVALCEMEHFKPTFFTRRFRFQGLVFLQRCFWFSYYLDLWMRREIYWEKWLPSNMARADLIGPPLYRIAPMGIVFGDILLTIRSDSFLISPFRSVIVPLFYSGLSVVWGGPIERTLPSPFCSRTR